MAGERCREPENRCPFFQEKAFFIAEAAAVGIQETVARGKKIFYCLQEGWATI